MLLQHPIQFETDMQHRYNNGIILICLLINTLTAKAEQGDSLRHWGANIYANPGTILNMKQFEGKYIVPHKNSFSVGMELNYATLPSDSDAFASDYDFPVFNIGLKYANNRDIKFLRDPVYEWREEDIVNHTSFLGDLWSLYGGMTRSLLRTNKWFADATVSMGTAYSHEKYNKKENVDNEIVGSRWLIFFGFGLHATYRLAEQWGVKAGLEYWHVSNGALNRPNRGANILGPSLALVYYPYYETVYENRKAKVKERFKPYWFLNFTAGLGAKTLEEDWSYTQFDLPSDHPDYRTEDFKLYTAWSTETDIMYRYARRWASGVGIDLFHGSYASRIEEVDKANKHDDKHSPWSVGLAAKHEAYFHNLALHVSLGAYLYREMGYRAKFIEKRYYETVGLRYAFPSLANLAVGFKVKAHYLKADYTELNIAMPIVLGK